jgi:hypothetical protein
MAEETIYSTETQRALDRMFATTDAVIEAWQELQHSAAGALEYHDDPASSAWLSDRRERIPADLRHIEEAEKLAHAEIAATRARVEEEA